MNECHTTNYSSPENIVTPNLFTTSAYFFLFFLCFFFKFNYFKREVITLCLCSLATSNFINHSFHPASEKKNGGKAILLRSAPESVRLTFFCLPLDFPTKGLSREVFSHLPGPISGEKKVLFFRVQESHFLAQHQACAHGSALCVVT